MRESWLVIAGWLFLVFGLVARLEEGRWIVQTRRAYFGVELCVRQPAVAARDFAYLNWLGLLLPVEDMPALVGGAVSLEFYLVVFLAHFIISLSVK